jgi:hypothetical protein
MSMKNSTDRQSLIEMVHDVWIPAVARICNKSDLSFMITTCP